MLRSPLLHFLLIGALLFALRLIGPTSSTTPVVEVRRSEIDARIAAFRSQMGRQPTEAETRSIEDQVIGDALWLERARALGLAETDSVVRQRLILNMRFLEGEARQDDEALYRRALELGMDESDTVVKRRLVDRVQAIFRARVRARPPDEANLRKYFEKNAARWREPTLLDFTHVYFSRDRRGESAERDAVALLGRLRAEAIPPEAATSMADPFIAGHTLHLATPNRIVARLGPAFAAKIAEVPSKTWSGPIESAFGVHLVWIEERHESRIPPLAEIRNRVEEDWIAGAIREALRAERTRLRRMFVVRILEDGDRKTADTEDQEPIPIPPRS